MGESTEIGDGVGIGEEREFDEEDESVAEGGEMAGIMKRSWDGL